jgi:hypothetical protein
VGRQSPLLMAGLARKRMEQGAGVGARLSEAALSVLWVAECGGASRLRGDGGPRQGALLTTGKGVYVTVHKPGHDRS